MEAVLLIGCCYELQIELIPEGEQLKVRSQQPLSKELREELRQHKSEVAVLLNGQSMLEIYKQAEIIAEAYAIANKVNDDMGIRDEGVREVNRLTRALIGLQDAGFPDEVWLPLQQRCREIEHSLNSDPKHAQTEVISPENVRPLIPCFACSGTDFWQRPDGGTVCSTCHPQPGEVASNKRQ
jgi:hypothetical protein